MPQSISAGLRREVPCLHKGDTVRQALTALLESGMPALPVLDERERLAGIFGEREFMTALFPGYVKELKFAAFLSSSLDEALEERSCMVEVVGTHLNTEHVDVPDDASDVAVAEVFLHHRVLIVPVVDAEGRVLGVVTRADFFRALAERALEHADA